MKTLYKILICGLCTLFLVPSLSLAQANTTPGTPGIDAARAGLNISADVAMPGITKTKNRSVDTLVGKAISTLLSFVGVLFMILIIAGGIIWMTAGGDESKVKKARQLMTNATIGLALVLAAYALTIFIIDTIIGAVS